MVIGLLLCLGFLLLFINPIISAQFSSSILYYQLTEKRSKLTIALTSGVSLSIITGLFYLAITPAISFEKPSVSKEHAIIFTLFFFTGVITALIMLWFYKYEKTDITPKNYKKKYIHIAYTFISYPLAIGLLFLFLYITEVILRYPML